MWVARLQSAPTLTLYRSASMIIYSIYKATNIQNGKCYIGFTKNYKKRLKEHKRGSLERDNVFYRAIRKYGWDSFDWQIIYQSKDGDYCKNIMETHFIIENDSYSNGYNMTNGGDGCCGIVPWNKNLKSDSRCLSAAKKTAITRKSNNSYHAWNKNKK